MTGGGAHARRPRGVCTDDTNGRGSVLERTFVCGYYTVSVSRFRVLGLVDVVWGCARRHTHVSAHGVYHAVQWCR